jgi:hypothetical protein
MEWSGETERRNQRKEESKVMAQPHAVKQRAANREWVIIGTHNAVV